MVANVRERLAVNKQAAHNSDVGRFNKKTINKLEVMKQYQITVPNRFAALENLHDNEDINRAWENKENIITPAKGSLCLYELKQYKARFDEECLSFFRSREAGQSAVVTGSKPNQCR